MSMLVEYRVSPPRANSRSVSAFSKIAVPSEKFELCWQIEPNEQASAPIDAAAVDREDCAGTRVVKIAIELTRSG